VCVWFKTDNEQSHTGRRSRHGEYKLKYIREAEERGEREGVEGRRRWKKRHVVDPRGQQAHTPSPSFLHLPSFLSVPSLQSLSLMVILSVK
jgi:hypothetical protein